MTKPFPLEQRAIGWLLASMALLAICGLCTAADGRAKDKDKQEGNRGIVSTTAPALPVETAPPPESEATVIEVKTPGNGDAPDAAAFDALRAEVGNLRSDLSQIRQTLDMLVNQVMADLEKENAQLRAELQRTGAERDQFGYATFPAVPRPGGALAEEVLSETPTDENGMPIVATEEEAARETEIEALKPASVPFDFLIVQEWGRTPEQAKELGGNTTSLKGIAGTVPMGSSQEDLENLGRELHEQFSGYDNINIEVFDDPVSARAFADSNALDPAHRVLSVSKYAADGRDAILLIQNGQTIEIAK